MTLGQVEAVKGNGWEAVEAIADILAKSPGDHTDVMTWLQQNRGNGFVQHVMQEIQAKGGASHDPTKKTTKFPIVLLHGFGASPTAFDSQIPAEMRSDGDAVFETTVPPYQTPEARAKILAPQLQQILTKTGATKLNLIAWSEGGLDARYLISSMGWGDKIASLSMLGTPNRGSATADTVSGVVSGTDKALDSTHTVLQHIQNALDLIDSKAQHGANYGKQLGADLEAIANDLRGLGVADDAAAITLDALAKVAEKVPALAGTVADKAAALALKLKQSMPTSVNPTLNGLAGKLGGDNNPMAGNANVAGAVASLSEANMAKFNQQNPDAKGVYYQSWAGVATPNGKLTPAQTAQLQAQGPMNGFQNPGTTAKLNGQGLGVSNALAKTGQNGSIGDGVVQVQSAEWGNFRGEIPANHYDLANASAQDRERTGFDTAEFYRNIARGLAQRGD